MSDSLEDVLEEAGKGTLLPLYLLAGDEFLVRKGSEDLIKRLLPDASAGLNLVVMDGASPREVGGELATLPLFPGKKLVLIRDPEFLAPKKGRGDAMGRAREAWRSGRRKEGARRVLALAARAGWGPGELDPTRDGAPGAGAWSEELGVELGELEIQFLKEVAAYCQEEGIRTPESDVSSLLDVLSGKLPEGHALVMVASELDAKNPLVKLAKDKGRFVERKVASKLKEVDLSDVAREVLGPLGKRLGPGAAEALKDRVGGNMRLVQAELEKLAVYVEGPTIQSADVALLVQRVRGEEYLELSDAVQKRDLPAALRYIDDALGNGAHALMLLGAVAGIVRNLLEAHERVSRISGGRDFRMSFPEFKSRVFPGIEEEVKARKGRVPHPYALYAGMQSASRFSREQLLRSLVQCAETDLALKSSASGKLSIERLLWTVCGRAS